MNDYRSLWEIHSSLVSLRTQTSVVVLGVDALVSAADYFDATGTESARSAQFGVWKQLSVKTDELAQDGRLGLMLREGTLEPSRWREIAQLTWNGFVTLQADVGKTAARFSDVWKEVVVPTSKTVASKAEEVAADAKASFWPLLVLLVVGLVALAVIKVK